MTRVLFSLFGVVALACSQTTPPIDTPATLPPAEPPADVTRASSGKATEKQAPEPRTESKPAEDR